jgi:hypothetical protein
VLAEHHTTPKKVELRPHNRGRLNLKLHDPKSKNVPTRQQRISALDFMTFLKRCGRQTPHPALAKLRGTS